VNDPFTQFQLDVFARLLGHEFFSDVAILAEDAGVTDADVNQQLATLRSANEGRTVKQGAAILVFQSEEAVEHPNVPGPETKVQIVVRHLEVPKINRIAGGTGKRAKRLGKETASLCHLWTRNGTTVTVAFKRRYNDGEGTIGEDVVLATHINLEDAERVAGVAITGSAAAVTLACATSGAAIRYTTDGSAPTPASSLYSAPFSVAAGTLVRATAFKSGLQAGDLSQTTIQA
jgi:hypothetical protein